MTQKNVCVEDSVQDEEVKFCENCGNIYRILWLKEEEDYNDFGYRYCPFCGNLSDELVNLKVS